METMDTSSMRSRRSREGSPDRARVYIAPKARALRKAQVIYYLSRNGQLEHPHFMEVSHLANQQLRLKDVMDRLSVLRGRAVTSMYSWSCKRTYKNGYVWNDLAENDVIYPAEGMEYVLKGSELAESPPTEYIRLLKLDPSRTARKSPPTSLKSQNLHHNHHVPRVEEEVKDMDGDGINDDDDDDDDDEEAEIVEDKCRSRCSRGVATEELDGIPCHHKQQEQEAASELHLRQVITISPSSSSSSEKTNHTMVTSNTNGNDHTTTTTGKQKIRTTKTPSALLQLIACGSVAGKGRAGMLMKPPFSPSSSSLRCNNSDGNFERKSLLKEVLSRHAANRASEGDEEDVIRYISENPRFGRPQVEEKEYFSGSIVESMATEKRAADVVSEPSLKRSSSYNEERSRGNGVNRAIEEEAEKITERTVKAKCIPGRKKQQQQRGH